MTPFDKLTDYDQECITEYITGCTGNYLTESLSYILRIWDGNKKDLFKAFDEELILTKEFEYICSPRMIQDNFQEIYGSTYNQCNFYTEYRHAVSNYALEYNLLSSQITSLYSLMNENTLYTNVYDGETIYIADPTSDKPFKLQEGAKAVRALGKLAKIFGIDDELYEEFRLTHSRILNQKTLKGEVCLSIHPLDYMTMSDNDSGWNSCMSWLDEGEYRQGTVEMMNSPYVVVAYLKSKNDMDTCCGFRWNNKKWRQLYIVCDQGIFAIRQYPYNNASLNDFCLSWLKELMEAQGEKYTIYPYENEAQDGIICFYCDERDVDYTFTFRTNNMYNDFRYDHSCYVSENAELNHIIKYSGPSECMVCGVEDKYIDSSSLTCHTCRNGLVCEYCGDNIYGEEYQYVNDMILCQACVENYTFYCDRCKEYYLEENMDYHTIALRSSKKYSPEKCGDYCATWLCDDCFKEVINDPEDYGEFRLDEAGGEYYVRFDDSTVDTFSLFRLSKYSIDIMKAQEERESNSDNNEDIRLSLINMI